MHLIHGDVQHIGFDWVPDVVEGDSSEHFLAVGDPRFAAGRDKGVFQPAGGLDRFIQVGKHKVIP